MLFKVVGVYSGVTKAEKKPFNMLHCVELEREQQGLRGVPVGTYFCTKEVADQIIPGETYQLETAFGTRNVDKAVLVNK